MGKKKTMDWISFFMALLALIGVIVLVVLMFIPQRDVLYRPVVQLGTTTGATETLQQDAEVYVGQSNSTTGLTLSIPSSSLNLRGKSLLISNAMGVQPITLDTSKITYRAVGGTGGTGSMIPAGQADKFIYTDTNVLYRLT